VGTVSMAWVGRGLIAACCALLLGCQTAPKPDPHAQKVAALQRVGFVLKNDAWELSLGVKLLFESNVDEVSEAGRAELADVARTLSEVGVDKVRVEGHSDNVGPAKYNEALSLRRAESVAQQLVRNGWRDAAIERHGYGFDKPIADNGTPEGRAQNRRVVVTVQAD
jgi:outer membrane protein OmpA-like peptidoglycan-associated protein